MGNSYSEPDDEQRENVSHPSSLHANSGWNRAGVPPLLSGCVVWYESEHSFMMVVLSSLRYYICGQALRYNCMLHEVVPQIPVQSCAATSSDLASNISSEMFSSLK